MNSFTTNYSALTAEQKKVVEAYNPNDDKITPFKKYKDALSGLSAVEKVTSSITQLKGKSQKISLQPQVLLVLWRLLRKPTIIWMLPQNNY